MSLIVRISEAFRSIWEIFRNPDESTYYPDDERKSKLVVWLDNLKWLLRYREINHFYYFWGCDRKKGPDPFEFVSKKKFCRRRDQRNARASINGKIRNYNCLLTDKLVFSQMLEGLGYPTPKTYAVCSRSHVRWLDDHRIQTLSEFVERDDFECFIKDILGERAERVYRLNISKGKIYLNSESVSYEEFSSKIGEINILQEAIRQHSLLDQMNAHSVNTMRIVTARKSDEIVVLSAMLRLGSKDGICDNLASGGLAVGIDLSSGCLGEWAFLKPGHGKRTQTHPDTNFVFKNVRLPFFEKTINMIEELHRYFYGCHSIGWDVAITPDGPVILEGNNSWEIPTLQVFDKALVKKYNDTLNEVDNDTLVGQ